MRVYKWGMGIDARKKLYPPIKDDPSEYYQSEGSSDGSMRGYKLHRAQPDHPENPRARPDEKFPNLLEGVGRHPEVDGPPKHSQSE